MTTFVMRKTPIRVVKTKKTGYRTDKSKNKIASQARNDKQSRQAGKSKIHPHPNTEIIDNARASI